MAGLIIYQKLAPVASALSLQEYFAGTQNSIDNLGEEVAQRFRRIEQKLDRMDVDTSDISGPADGARVEPMDLDIPHQEGDPCAARHLTPAPQPANGALLESMDTDNSPSQGEDLCAADRAPLPRAALRPANGAPLVSDTSQCEGTHLPILNKTISQLSSVRGS